MNSPITTGSHHIGLSVSRLEASADFFVSLLGWKEVRRREDYPAIFVSDGNIMITLWATKEQPSAPFDRKKNVGLHHLALKVDSEADLEALHGKLAANGIEIEFPPEQLGPGPARHMMCYDPSGIRVEFIWPGSQ